MIRTSSHETHNRPPGKHQNHPVFKKPEIREKFITNEFLLDDPKALILPEMIPYLLELHPIQVIPGKNDSYYCVGGLRSLSIVQSPVAAK